MFYELIQKNSAIRTKILRTIRLMLNKTVFTKGELQCQNKLIPSERPFKILQNETKIIKTGQAVLEIFKFQL